MVLLCSKIGQHTSYEGHGLPEVFPFGSAGSASRRGTLEGRMACSTAQQDGNESFDQGLSSRRDRQGIWLPETWIPESRTAAQARNHGKNAATSRRRIPHLGVDARPPVDIVAAVHCPRVPADAVPDDAILHADNRAVELCRHARLACQTDMAVSPYEVVTHYIYSEPHVISHLREAKDVGVLHVWQEDGVTAAATRHFAAALARELAALRSGRHV